MKTKILKTGLYFLLSCFLLTACQKEETFNRNGNGKVSTDDGTQLKADAQNSINQTVAANTAFGKNFNTAFSKTFNVNSQSVTNKISLPLNLITVVSKLPFFSALTAAVVKTGLASTLASPDFKETVFAPIDAAFAKLPAPFNNAANINAITDQSQIDALKNILLYHVLGTEVLSKQIASGRSSTTTLKPVGSSNDNTVYLSKEYGLLALNGNTLVLIPDLVLSNAVVHVIDNVLAFPSQNIAQIAVGNSGLTVLVAALVKTNLVGVFQNAGDFTVFAPTDAAFAKLPAPFNTAANISAITDQTQIDALANILKYHVIASRYFSLDFGFFGTVTTIAAAPNNTLIGLLGLNRAYVKGDQNKTFAYAYPANILATNGVVHVVNQVLQP